MEKTSYKSQCRESNLLICLSNLEVRCIMHMEINHLFQMRITCFYTLNILLIVMHEQYGTRFTQTFFSQLQQIILLTTIGHVLCCFICYLICRCISRRNTFSRKRVIYITVWFASSNDTPVTRSRTQQELCSRLLQREPAAYVFSCAWIVFRTAETCIKRRDPIGIFLYSYASC